MTKIMSKKDYILTEGTALNPQAFYVTFGFKTRAFAEETFKQAVIQAYEETISFELKAFLEEEFLNNNFKMLTESRYLDIYWCDTAQEVISLNSRKRNLELLLSESSNKMQRTEKDRRLSNNLTNNNIIDLSNTGNSSQCHDNKEWSKESVKADSYFQLPVLHYLTNQAVEAVTIKNMSDYKRYLKSLSYQQQSPEEAIHLYQVITIIMNAHCTHPSLFDLSSPEEYSEQDISNIIWAPIFDALFARTPIIVKSGETVLRDSNKVYKIDSRLGIKINGNFVDIANVEIGKEVETTKIKDGHHKVILEASTIIRRIITSFYFINPTSFTIFSLQICRLNGDLLYTRLLEPSKYRTECACSRIRVPLKPTDTNGMKMFLRTLLLFRDQVEEAASGVKDDVINAINTRRSFGPVLEENYKDNLPRYTSWIEEN